MVGSRNPTSGGQQNAYEFAKFLGQAGLTITSGLALGIDAASHQGALVAGAPTIAVMGTGLDQIYPSQHQQLAEDIQQHGALVSEFPLGTPMHGSNFPRRNRIVSGMSLGVLVVEATLRSGSLITAKHAIEQSREVFAIPGSIHSPLSKGCHKLIREGAKLVETAQDIIVEIGALAQAVFEMASTFDTSHDAIVHNNETKTARLGESDGENDTLDDEYQTLLDAIAYDPVSADTLMLRTGLSAQAVSSMLLMLELKGYINANPGGTYVKANYSNGAIG